MKYPRHPSPRRVDDSEACHDVRKTTMMTKNLTWSLLVRNLHFMRDFYSPSGSDLLATGRLTGRWFTIQVLLTFCTSTTCSTGDLDRVGSVDASQFRSAHNQPQCCTFRASRPLLMSPSRVKRVITRHMHPRLSKGGSGAKEARCFPRNSAMERF